MGECVFVGGGGGGGMLLYIWLDDIGIEMVYFCMCLCRGRGFVNTGKFTGRRVCGV